MSERWRGGVHKSFHCYSRKKNRIQIVGLADDYYFSAFIHFFFLLGWHVTRLLCNGARVMSVSSPQKKSLKTGVNKNRYRALLISSSQHYVFPQSPPHHSTPRSHILACRRCGCSHCVKYTCSRLPFSTHRFPLNDNGNSIVRRIKYDLFVVYIKIFFSRGAQGPEHYTRDMRYGMFFFHTVAIADNKYKVKIILNISRGVCDDTRLFWHKSANAENQFSERVCAQIQVVVKRTRIFICFVPSILNYHVANRASNIRSHVRRFVYSLLFFLFFRLASSPMNRKRTVP